MKARSQYKFYLHTNQKRDLNDWLWISRYWYNRQLERLTWWQNEILPIFRSHAKKPTQLSVDMRVCH
ncbi:MAG: helix-turn-helix domain-containing protein [Rhizonema sp. NSF051]|nr:helix-turn-helix domain-containing protein [Rhizonema sp. NSF051]